MSRSTTTLNDSPELRAWQRAPWKFALAVIAVVLMTAIIHFTHADISFANMPILYLVCVTLVALFLGSWPAVLASFLSFLAFDYFFVQPKYQLTVQDPAEWLALCLFLLTAILNGQLTAILRAKIREAETSKRESYALSEASWAVASELDTTRALDQIIRQIAEILHVNYAAIFRASSADEFALIAESKSPAESANAAVSKEALKLASVEGRSIGWNGSSLWEKALEKGTAGTYIPIVMENEVFAVLCLALPPQGAITDGARRVVQSLLNHAALAMQRDRLMKAQSRAQALEEADKLKTALLSMISHDFRSPLTSIKASVSNLLVDDAVPLDPETQKSLLETVDQETDRLNRMVGNILDLSRLETGAWRPRKELSEVSEIVGAALDSFSVAENRRIAVEVHPDLPEINIDSVQLVQVLRNLIENALKYSPEDSKVELIVRKQDDTVLFEVLDRGVGLPKGDEALVFERFYRAPGLKESAVPGVGLGLALSRGLVEANGGKLIANNRSGGGAVFRVSISVQQPAVERA